MQRPVVPRDLDLRVGRSETEHMVSWLCAIANLPGNPFAAGVCRLGGATALFGTRLGPLFNRVLDFSDADILILDEAIRLYSERGLPCRIDLNPRAVGSATFSRLVEAGFCPFRHHDHLYGILHLLDSPEGEVEVREVGESDRGLWAQAWATGLHVANGIGTLAFAGTDPAFRGRGCQVALLRARLRKAAELGCDLVATQAALDAQSSRNMQREGLSIAYTRAFWLRQPLV